MLLAIDTSTAQLGLALYNGTQVAGEMVWTSSARHTQELAPALEALLSRCGKTIDEVKALGVATGPGSFTSLRVGLAFAKGLALARAIPLVGIPTLDIVAACVPLADRKLAAVLQAGRGRLALAWYKPGENGWQAQGPASVTTAEELEQKIRKPVIICGELSAEDRHRLARKYKNITLASPAQCVRRPGVLAEIAWQRWQAGEVDSAVSLAPIYLHLVGGLPA
jgi:tRNA threonylcarbamoyladenosine biosynthesis protein TsaB